MDFYTVRKKIDDDSNGTIVYTLAELKEDLIFAVMDSCGFNSEQAKFIVNGVCERVEYVLDKYSGKKEEKEMIYDSSKCVAEHSREIINLGGKK